MPAKLNPPQQAAVDTLSGPLLVLAGAGTGKTRVVTFRIANLIRHGTKPDRILGVTFTNKAAAEMQERVGALLGRQSKAKPLLATFHSFCVRALRRHIKRLGYPETFTIYDRGDQESLARSVLREIRVPGEMMRPGDLLWQISSWKSASIRPDAAAGVAETDKEHLAAVAYRRYQRSLKNAGAVDFDDLLLLTEDLFQQHPDVRREEAGRFDHVLIDEYQDTNQSQYQIVRALSVGHRNLCVVGDDDQSIYGWRGAEVEHILRFSRDWPDAKVVRLEMNYRSTAEIIGVANRLIAFNKQRHDKMLRPARPGGEKTKIWQFKNEETEAGAVIADIKKQLSIPGVEPRDIAILFRTNEQPRVFETELRKANLPYTLIGGQSFFDRKEVRDLLSYVKTLIAPHDETSLLRIINNPPRGIGQKSVETLLGSAVERGKPIWDVISNSASMPSLPQNARASVGRFANMIRQFRGMCGIEPKGKPQAALSELLGQLIREIGYVQELTRLYPNPEERQSRTAAVEEVVNALATYERQAEQPTLAGFIEDVTLGDRDFDNDKEKQLRGNAIVLMTLHSAKGLEFPRVYMVGMEEGILPHHRSIKADDAAIDEERRLCYVGVTRAQERLCLSMALSRMKWGKPRESIPSRFLFEIIGQADNPNHAGNRRRGGGRKTSAKR